MKSFSAILLLLLFLSPFLIKMGVVTSWLIQYDYIVENVCEKREEVKNTCNGKCLLSKNLEKVDKATEPEENDAQLNTSKLEYSFFTHTIQSEFYNAPSFIVLAIKPLDTYKNQFCPHIDIPPPRLV